VIGDGPGADLSLAAHGAWFAPTDLRCTEPAIASPGSAGARGNAERCGVSIGYRIVALAEALAADIVCIHVPLALTAAQLRRGTHVNALARVTLDDDLRRLAMVVDEARGLPVLVAGLVDGRQLDELTVFLAGHATIAVAAWHARCIRAR
jgi:hypothetical protein